MSRRRRRRREAPPPAVAAGLLRFFEEELHGMRFRPEIIILIAILLIVFSILANLGFLGLLPAPGMVFSWWASRAGRGGRASASCDGHR